MMDTLLFTDYGILMFAITTSAIALMLSVFALGFGTCNNAADTLRHSAPIKRAAVKEGVVDAE